MRRTTSEAATGTGLTAVTTTTTYGVDGQPTSVASGGATRTLTYETSSGLLDQVKDGTTVLTDYAWSADGTLASRLDDGVGTASFAYDWADRLTGVTPPSGLGYTNAISQAWRLDGMLASTTYGNGETATLAYDEARRPERIDLSANRWLSRAYDRTGNVTSDDRSLAGGIGRERFDLPVHLRRDRCPGHAEEGFRCGRGVRLRHGRQPDQGVDGWRHVSHQHLGCRQSPDQDRPGDR